MSFAGQTRVRSAPTVPLAGIVDILFLMLVFFLTTATLREQEQLVDINVAATEESGRASTQAPVTITVTSDNRIFVGQVERNLDEMKTIFQRLEDPDMPIVVRGDGEAEYGVIMRVLGAVRDLGFENVSQATTKIVDGP